jgi:hypothetical protein
LYRSSNAITVIKSRRMGWVGHVACIGRMRIAYRSLGRKPEGKRPLGIFGHKWEEMGIKE